MKIFLTLKKSWVSFTPSVIARKNQLNFKVVEIFNHVHLFSSSKVLSQGHSYTLKSWIKKFACAGNSGLKIHQYSQNFHFHFVTMSIVNLYRLYGTVILSKNPHQYSQTFHFHLVTMSILQFVLTSWDCRILYGNYIYIHYRDSSHTCMNFIKLIN